MHRSEWGQPVGVGHRPARHNLRDRIMRAIVHCTRETGRVTLSHLSRFLFHHLTNSFRVTIIPTSHLISWSNQRGMIMAWYEQRRAWCRECGQHFVYRGNSNGRTREFCDLHAKSHKTSSARLRKQKERARKRTDDQLSPVPSPVSGAIATGNSPIPFVKVITLRIIGWSPTLAEAWGAYDLRNAWVGSLLKMKIKGGWRNEK